ncbi:hypothetical protein LOTGIDRAFT_176637, partial [Lottia gigantea]
MGDALGVTGLELTTDYLIEILNTSNVCDIIQAAVTYSILYILVDYRLFNRNIKYKDYLIEILNTSNVCDIIQAAVTYSILYILVYYRLVNRNINNACDKIQAALTTDYLIEILNTSNACDIIQAAVKFSNNDLRDESVQFIAAHTM